MNSKHRGKAATQKENRLNFTKNTKKYSESHRVRTLETSILGTLLEQIYGLEKVEYAV